MQLDYSYLIKTFWLCVKAIPVTLEITILEIVIREIGIGRHIIMDAL